MQRTYHILLVDDEEAGRLLLKKRLEQDEYAVTVAENGQQALDLMQVENFDLVLLDMYMPELDGLETLDAIKSDPVLCKVAVVMLTAANTREHVIQSLSLGAVDYLIKPINPIEFRQRVRRCLENEASQVEPTVRISREDMNGNRILIIDDEPLNSMLLERRLQHLGCQVFTAQNGRDGLNLLSKESIDAVLLDVNMPEIDGLEVLHCIRKFEQWRFLPVLMLSADGAEDTISRSYQLGASDYLVKPYQFHDLQLRLAVALDVGEARANNAGVGDSV